MLFNICIFVSVLYLWLASTTHSTTHSKLQNKDHLQGLFYNLFFIQMKNTKKSLISTLNEIKNNLGYSYDEDYGKIYNLCQDYMDETCDRSIETCFEDFMDYDLTEDCIKSQISSGGLARLPYLVGDTRFTEEYYKLNAYGNIKNIDEKDLEYLIDDIVERLS